MSTGSNVCVTLVTSRVIQLICCRVVPSAELALSNIHGVTHCVRAARLENMRTRSKGHMYVMHVQSAHILWIHKMVLIPVNATKVTPAMTALQLAEIVQAKMRLPPELHALTVSFVQSILTKTYLVTVNVCRVQQTARPLRSAWKREPSVSVIVAHRAKKQHTAMP